MTDRIKKENRSCSVEACSRTIYAREWCQKHYSRWRITGHPEKTLYDMRPSFDSYVEKQGGCLIWVGSINSDGYGSWFHEGRHEKAHRFAWERVNGLIPESKVLDHICHNRSCVNVEHLRLATRVENSWHRSEPNPNSSSGVRNVHRSGKRWKIIIRKHGESYYFGTFDTPEEARPVAEAARRKLFGEFAGRS